MVILQYIGKAEYTDPKGRFIIAPLSHVEFTEEEANFILEGGSKEWQLAELSGLSTKQAEQVRRSRKSR
jgi:hypothetical protein